MRNAVVTKEKILNHAGRLFNTKGYKATSLSDITASTGLTKGAIYRHFENKEILERETLGYLEGIMLENVRRCVVAKATAPEKLKAIFRYFESYISHPPVVGGCPLLNAAIESDDTDQKLRKKALSVLNTLRESVRIILKNGIKYNQLKADIDKDYYATIIIASLEGAIMMSKLQGDAMDIKRVIKHLEKMVGEMEL